MCPQISALVWFKAKKAIHLVKCYSKFAKILVNTHDLACWYFDIQPSTPLKKGKLRRQETRCADLHELHEEVDVLGVELLAEVVDGLVHVLRQRVLLAAPDEVALAPDPLHVLPWRRRLRRRRGRRHFGCFPLGWEAEETASWWLVPGPGEEGSFLALFPGHS